MSDPVLSIPKAPARAAPDACARALRERATHWRSHGGTVLPAGLVDWVFGALLRRLQSGAVHAESLGDAAAALPAGWPHSGQHTAALDELQHDCLATLLDCGALDRPGLDAVHAVFGLLRRAISERAAPETTDVEALRQALDTRDRQLSIASHELRTPIASILLNLEVLERTARMKGSLDAEAVARMLAAPARQLRRLTHMVERLLDAAQAESARLVLHRQEVDLCQLVHEAALRLDALAREAGCTLDLGGCEPVVGRWDRLRLEQVVNNLLTNAIKYGGGRVEIATHAAGHARIVVRDHGAGIAAEDQERIFEPYERLAASAGEDGAGLGLYIVREIVRAHGGRVAVDSRPGAGARFVVELPI